MSNRTSYRILVLGDVHFGESYLRAGARILNEYGYSHSSAKLNPFIQSSDSFILNLETPLIDHQNIPSPLEGKKSYIHWSDPQASGSALKALGVDAVSLANNHTLDQGIEGLESTFHSLSKADIQWFGAGTTIAAARAPYRVAIPERVGGGQVHFHGSFQYSKRHDVDFGFYAGTETSGCAPLAEFDVPEARPEAGTEDTFQVAFPHWGRNYAWRSPEQYRLAHRFLKKDYDLVLGHGGHSIQEVHRKQQRWVVYGVGNGMFNSGGRWNKYEKERGIPPFSFWSMLEVHRDNKRRWLELKLYPVYSDNSVTNFQPGPVSSRDFNRLVETLASRPVRAWRFDNTEKWVGLDHLGHHIGLNLGEWPQGKRPTRLIGPVNGRDPGDWPLRGPSRETEDRVLRLNKHMGASMLALGAEANGGTVRWLNNEVALIEADNKRFLAQRYRSYESSLGALVVNDKLLTYQLLEEAEVPTPKTFLVGSEDEAVEMAKSISGPVVVKPRGGLKSRGVSTDLLTEDDVREAFQRARQISNRILVQQHIQSDEEVRVVASAGKAVAVIRRVLPHVIGDGMSTVGQLIDDKNLQRAINPSLFKRPIPMDSVTRRYLGRQGIDYNSVPEMGETITVRNVAGLSVGADANQAMETVPLEFMNVAARAVEAVPGLGWGGVDLIVEKHSGNPYVIEINTEAGFGQAIFPTYGAPIDVGRDWWKLRLQATEPETTETPDLSLQSRSALSILSAFGLKQQGPVIEFSRLFEASLVGQGYFVRRRTEKILEIPTAPGKSIMVSKMGLTSADLSVVRHVMRRHRWVNRILSFSGIRRPRVATVTSLDQLKAFVSGRVGSVTISPVRGAWASAESRILTEQQVVSLEALPFASWVQARPRGLRLRIMATRWKAYTVLANELPVRLGRRDLVECSRVAVDAVRAVPELRWGAVDVLLRSERNRWGRPGRILVEGISIEPSFSAEAQIIAGDLNPFFRWIVESGSS